MVTYKVLLDTRRAKSDGTYSVQIRITANRISSTANTGVFVKKEFWDEAQSKVFNTHPNAPLLNRKITEFYLKVQKAVIELESENSFSFGELKGRLSTNVVAPKINRVQQFKEYADQLISDMLAINKAGNSIVYQTATNRLMGYAGNPKLKFTDITYTFLEGFKRQLIKDGVKVNSISNSDIEAKTKEESLAYLKGCFDTYELIRELAVKEKNQGSKDMLQNFLDKSFISTFYTSKMRVNEFKVDNYIHEDRVKGYYKSFDLLQEAYKEQDKQFTPTYSIEDYAIGDKDRIYRQSKVTIKEQQKETIGFTKFRSKQTYG
ncbi:phage integrase SAM-like domain-containing protein [Mucilaginibacter sabulilitoris]|uniref:Phage integrase SAM-like domain-containing protein n=1 Tax=Mucilaginibacter sabulilitoris TaxID=1173583 RepID=A0ABZ0TLH3_9SPHI|nr:phage integrase SAM-like domain-containing protein [Mucilaginibacter sabulilitoris]WPU94016.1 phage integrase SAM-like domain-containing protein [Mucilaginibacter sabulilitoris]